MKIAHIVPPNWVNTFASPNITYQMTLAHWVLGLGSEEYLKKLRVRDPKVHLLMDNGTFEGESHTIKELNKACSLAKANEVVLPDSAGNPGETLRYSWSALDKIVCENVLFAPQGHTLEEWCECLKAWVGKWESSTYNDSYNLSIGIPSIRKTGSTKPVGVSKAEQITYAAKFNYPIHLLGLPDLKRFVEEDLKTALDCGIRGIDTSTAFALGAEGKLVSSQTKKTYLKGPLDYQELPTHRRRLIHLNMAILNDWIRTGDAAQGIFCGTIRQCASRWLKFWAEGLAPLSKVMRACGMPLGRYALTKVRRRELFTRPLNKLERLAEDETLIQVVPTIR